MLKSFTLFIYTYINGRTLFYRKFKEILVELENSPKNIKGTLALIRAFLESILTFWTENNIFDKAQKLRFFKTSTFPTRKSLTNKR